MNAVMTDFQKSQLGEWLEGKTIASAKITGSSLKLILDDGSVIEAAAKSGVDPDGKWHTWTEISVNGIAVINK